jgi:lipoprotein-releasing system ATP-binding protein
MSLVVSSLTKSFETRSGVLPILKGIDLQLKSGEALAVTGPSGSGKSTLLYIIGTLDRPTSGKVMLNGVNPFELPEAELATFRNRQIGFVFQDHHLLPQCSVLENVLVPTLISKVDRVEIEKYAKELLNRVGLGNRMEHRPAELSGGERQRAAIARALVLKPTLLLADEPTGNLDRTNAHSIANLLLELQQSQKLSLIVVTHSMELAKLLPRRLEMDDGKLKIG